MALREAISAAMERGFGILCPLLFICCTFAFRKHAESHYVSPRSFAFELALLCTQPDFNSALSEKGFGLASRCRPLNV